MSRMHKEDTHDDNLIAMETSNQIHTRAQIRVAKNAATSHILETGELKNNANPPLDVHDDTPGLPAAKHAKTFHFCQRVCRRALLLATMLPPHAHLLNMTKMVSIYMQILPITANLRPQKHLHVIHFTAIIGKC